jgi:hypothetical protein
MHSLHVVLPNMHDTQNGIEVQFVVHVPFGCRAKLLTHVTHPPEELHNVQLATEQLFIEQNCTVWLLNGTFIRVNPGLHSLQGPIGHLLQFFTVQKTLQALRVEVNRCPGLHWLQIPDASRLQFGIVALVHFPVVLLSPKPSAHHLHVPM